MVEEKDTESGNSGQTKPAAADRLASAREKFGDVVESKIRGIKEGGGRASEAVRERAQRATEGAREKYEGAREGARQGYERVSKDLEHLGEDVNEYVRHNPGKAVAMALGAGFVLGILLRGRRD